MKTEFLKLLIADRARLIPIFTGAVVWLVVRLAGSAGLPLEVNDQNNLALFVGLTFGYAMEAWSRNLVVAGTKEVQTSLQQATPSLTVDGIPGPKTVAATQDAVATAVTKP